ncbi:hypothetical protein F5884DRAFT_860883 [Xylogone sp. PMI_703]|nr:hypothetical protein F5884DRAFT_860883 [Xylogone sp. PMI_703]
MAEPFNLHAYKCNHLPNMLWKVIHSGTQSRQDPHTKDLTASDNTRIISNILELKQVVEAHLDWWNRQPSCFLSVFSDERHARNWAKQRERTSSQVYIYQIDTRNLPTDAYPLDLDLMKVRLSITNPSTHELLFLHRIPAQAIVGKTDLGEIFEKEADAKHYAARPFDPSYHWVDDLYGYYDSDEECEEHNRCDDILKMIEGDWN